LVAGLEPYIIADVNLLEVGISIAMELIEILVVTYIDIGQFIA